MKRSYMPVWALKTLRNYLYGVSDLEIHTDHQRLSFAVSERNPNIKIKRWRSFIEKFSPKIIYKPGATNVVADALSRQILNNLTSSEESDQSIDSVTNTQHSAESSDEYQIHETKKPLNHFKQQILINGGARITVLETISNFNNKRFLIEYDIPQNIVSVLKEYMNPKVVTGIYCTPEVIYEIKNVLREAFPTVKFLYTKLFANDVTNREDQGAIIEQTHNREHRNYRENLAQIRQEYYWPLMVRQFKQYAKNCNICNNNKYERHPKLIPIGEAPIPEKEGEQLHIDIFFAQKLKFITCLDSYSKYLVIKYIEDKINLEDKILELLQTFPDVKSIVIDNEPGFSTIQFKSLMERFNIQIYYCAPRHSTSNGQIERVHSTLIEISRCLKQEHSLISDYESIMRAVQQYNKTIHSVTGKKPCNILFNREAHGNMRDMLKNAQEKMLEHHNKKRVQKNYHRGEVIYEKLYGERNKLKPKYKRQIVVEDLGNRVKIQSRNRIIHKDNIKV